MTENVMLKYPRPFSVLLPHYPFFPRNIGQFKDVFGSGRTAGPGVWQVQNMKKYLPNDVKQVFYLACQEGLTLYRPAGGA